MITGTNKRRFISIPIDLMKLGIGDFVHFDFNYQPLHLCLGSGRALLGPSELLCPYDMQTIAERNACNLKNRGTVSTARST